MSGRRSEAADNLLLIAATAIFVLTAQRYLQTTTAPAHEPAIAARNSFVPELAQRGRGRLAAALLWIAGSSLLSRYLSNFGHYDATYGSLGAAIGLMMWMWMSAIIVLCGAELNAEIEHQTARDSTVGRPKPLGARGALTADTVGPAVPAESEEH